MDSYIDSYYIDSYSGWFEVDGLTSTTAQAVITKLKNHFARFGTPDELQSDNGPQFCATEFRTFSKQYGFTHVTSSPTYMYPQSKGLVENAVKQVKHLFKRCKSDGSDPYLGLLNIRNVPRDNTLGSQAQRMMSRRTKSLLPISSQLLQPSVISGVPDCLKELRNQQKKYYMYDKTAKSLYPLKEGDTVRMQTEKGYNKLATVRESNSFPERSY